jgi:hypothetical protein
MLTCPFTEFCWSFVSEALGWQRYPRSMNGLISSWLLGKFGISSQTRLSCFARLAWAIWNIRNKIIQKMEAINEAVGEVQDGGSDEDDVGV